MSRFLLTFGLGWMDSWIVTALTVMTAGSPMVLKKTIITKVAPHYKPLTLLSLLSLLTLLRLLNRLLLFTLLAQKHICLHMIWRES